jgi:xanthine dehydrogenase accessory factor
MADAHDVRTDLSAIGEWATPWTAVVVATHGHFDEPAVAAALRTPAAYVALVASRKRAAEVAAYLDGEGLTAERGRLRSPAGLDIGARRGDEIALSIVAEIVQQRRTKEDVEHVAEPAAKTVTTGRIAADPGPAVANDPVCGMEVTVTATTPSIDHAGERYHFCCPGCASKFAREPDRYLEPVQGR